MQEKGEVLRPSDTLKRGNASPLLHDEITERKQLSEVGITPIQSHRWKWNLEEFLKWKLTKRTKPGKDAEPHAVTAVKPGRGPKPRFKVMR